MLIRDGVYPESREAVNEDVDSIPVYNFSFKLKAWAGIDFNGVTEVVISS